MGRGEMSVWVGTREGGGQGENVDGVEKGGGSGGRVGSGENKKVSSGSEVDIARSGVPPPRRWGEE